MRFGKDRIWKRWCLEKMGFWKDGVLKRWGFWKDGVWKIWGLEKMGFGKDEVWINEVWKRWGLEKWGLEKMRFGKDEVWKFFGKDGIWKIWGLEKMGLPHCMKKNKCICNIFFWILNIFVSIFGTSCTCIYFIWNQISYAITGCRSSIHFIGSMYAHLLRTWDDVWKINEIYPLLITPIHHHY